MRIIFMGTPDIAAECLKGVVSAGHQVCAVFTRMDKPVGRKQVLTPPLAKQVALQFNIPVYQPKNLRDEQTAALIKSLNADIIVVVAYGCILPKQILNIPPKGCINLHVSILPQYRGAAPVQWAVINGDKKTGVTVMYMDEGLDTGDIIDMTEVDILPNETSGELFTRVTDCGIKTLCDTLLKIDKNNYTRTKQDNAKATFAPPLTKEMAKLSFDKDAAQTHNLIRGLNPWPMAFFADKENKKIKIVKSQIVLQQGKPGQILSLKPLIIACQKDALQLCEVVPEGKKPMDGTAWALGKRFNLGESVL